MVRVFDVVIVGGGPAGLSAALCLVRSHRSVAVLDSAHYRNDGASHMQNLISHDGRPPREFLDLCLADCRRYPSFTLLHGLATHVTSRPSPSDYPSHGLELTVNMQTTGDAAALETFRARRLVLATGVVDVLPSIPGLKEAWGDVAHLCPYCHGWEHRGTPWALLLPGGDAQPLPEGVQGVMGAAFASMFLPVLASFHPTELTVFTNGRPITSLGFNETQLAGIRARATVNEKRIVRVEQVKVKSTLGGAVKEGEVPPSDDGLRVVMEDGSGVDVGLFFLRPPFLHSPLVTQLGLKLKAPFNMVEGDMFFKSSNPLVYVAGDVSNPFPSVAAAMGQGGIVGAGLNNDLAQEEWGKALQVQGVKAEDGHGAGFLKAVADLMKPAATKAEEAKAAS